MRIKRKVETALRVMKKLGYKAVVYRLLANIEYTLMKIYRGMLERNIRSVKVPFFVIRLFNGKLILIDSKDRGIGLDLLMSKEGIREPLASKFLWNMDIGGTFVDIGANIGYYTVLLSDKFKKIIAIEPISNTVKILDLNLRLNNINAVVINKAVTTHGNPVNMQVGDESNWAKVAKKGNIRIDSIKLTNLREYTKRIDLMKMDIEGYEYELLVNSKEFLNSDIAPKVLFIELHTGLLNKKQAKEVLKVLDDAGYRIIGAFLEPPFKFEKYLPFWEKSTYPYGPELCYDKPVSWLIKQELLLEGRYGAIELILKKQDT